MFKQIVAAGLAILFLGSTACGWAEMSAEETQQMLKVAKDKMDATTWEVELTRTSASGKTETGKDTIRFIDGRVESEKMSAEGFARTNFTVRLKGEDTLIWETMQTSEENGLAFWRGEFRKGRMRGVLSWHVDEKTVKDYSFISEENDLVLIPTEEDLIAAQQAEKEALEKAAAEKKAREQAKKEAEEKAAAAAKQAAKEKAAAEKAAAKAEAATNKAAAEEGSAEEAQKEEPKKKGWFWGR